MFRVLLIAEFALAPLVFFLLLFITAPYGRFRRGGWGPQIPSRVAWMIMEMPSFAIPLIIAFTGSRTPAVVIFLLIWESHYFHRAIIYPFRISDPFKPFSILIMSWGFLFNMMNSYIVFHSLAAGSGAYDLQWFGSWQFIAGVVLFVFGYTVNRHSDFILRKLRSKGNGEYAIPRGGLYRRVSSPNYLGEMIEWGGFALLTWSPAALAFFLFTIGNLFPRALKNHKWYRETFTAYPPERKAIIPWLW